MAFLKPELYIFSQGDPFHSLFDLPGFLFQNEFLVLFYFLLIPVIPFSCELWGIK